MVLDCLDQYRIHRRYFKHFGSLENSCFKKKKKKKDSNGFRLARVKNQRENELK